MKTTMYRVEKFLPPECPKCRARFGKEGMDYARLIGDIVKGEKVIRETNGYRIITCQHCRNYTACYPLETYQLKDKTQAEALVRDEGFVNLIEVQSMGDGECRDMHSIEGQMSELRVESVKCD